MNNTGINNYNYAEGNSKRNYNRNNRNYKNNAEENMHGLSQLEYNSFRHISRHMPNSTMLMNSAGGNTGVNTGGNTGGTHLLNGNETGNESGNESGNEATVSPYFPFRLPTGIANRRAKVRTKARTALVAKERENKRLNNIFKTITKHTVKQNSIKARGKRHTFANIPKTRNSRLIIKAIRNSLYFPPGAMVPVNNTIENTVIKKYNNDRLKLHRAILGDLKKYKKNTKRKQYFEQIVNNMANKIMNKRAILSETRKKKK